MNPQRLQQLQHVANDNQKNVYIYLLQNGNTFAALTPFTRSEIINGSKIEKVIDIIKPQK